MEVWEKSQTVDPEVRAYVHSLVNAVGGQSTLDDRYAVGDDALAVLGDLRRWLLLYDEKLDRFDVKRCLAEANLVKGDLLEILSLWPEEVQENKVKRKLALLCLQLLTPLTWPIELEEEKATVNHHRHTPYLQLAQVGYKRSILHFENAKILRTAVRIGLPSMAQPRRERTRRDEATINVLLYFFRNIVMITQPQQLPSQGDENEISRSATIEAFHDQDVFSLLLTIGSGAVDDFQEQDVVVLEILFHLLKGIDAKKLFMDDEQKASHETNELEMLMCKERAMHKGYNKHAPTRHNRFGTTIWVKRDEEKVSTVSGQGSITNENGTLQHMDSSKKWNRPRYNGKLTEEVNENSDFNMRVDLTESARKYLRSFVEDFLDSSFNPVFSSLRKAMEREHDRVKPTHHSKFFYLISWFLAADAARRDQIRRKSSEPRTNASNDYSEDNTFAYIAAVLDQETFVLLNRYMQRAFDEKRWQDLQAILLCFTQILLTVQAMTESKDDEDQEIAENIQNRIFYEESTHDRMVQILRAYNNQGFSYLDATTECVHVFVRMLERYSKQNADLQIRSKRRARKRNKDANVNQDSSADKPDDDDDDNAAADEQEIELVVRERKFDFARFSGKFLTQPCVNTFLSLLRFYADLNADQLKRCHRYFYRLAFKAELAVLLFRIDILQLFHKLIKGPEGLPSAVEGFKEWELLVQQIFRRCIKWIDRPNDGEGWREASIVEMLFSKIPNTLFYLQNGYDLVVEKKAPRPPAELDIKASVEEADRIPVAVSMMLEQGKQDAVDWIKREIQKAIDERKAWADQQAASSNLEAPSLESEGQNVDGTSDAPGIFLSPDSDERKLALFKDKHLRLLLQTLGIERLGADEDVDASWVIPGNISVEKLQDILAAIKKTEFDTPTFADGKTAMDLIRNKASTRHGATFSDTDSDGDTDEAMFPANLREKRKQGDEDGREKKKRRLTNRKQADLTEEEIQERAAERKRREQERNAKIKSQLFVSASDDESDAEADAEFFRLEAVRRQQNAANIRDQLLSERSNQAGGKKKSKKAQAAEVDPMDVDDTSLQDGHSALSESEEEDDEDAASVSSQQNRSAEQTQQQEHAIQRQLVSDEDDAEGDDEVVPNASMHTARRGRRPIFLDDSDDDDDESFNGGGGDVPAALPPTVRV